MPPELDFRTLRAQVEAITRVPDFSTVRRRARKVRRRDRLAIAGSLIGTLAVFSPIAITAIVGRSVENPSMLGRPDRDGLISQPDGTTDGGTAVDASTPKITTRLLAAGGALPSYVYVAVDACMTPPGDPVRPRCSLQVTLVSKASPGGAISIASSLVRANPSDQVSDVALTPLTGDSVLLSATAAGGVRSNMRVTGTGAAPLHAPSGTVPLDAGARPIQLAEHGAVYGVRSTDGQLSELASQPGLTTPTVATGLPVGKGWWVTGYDQETGKASIAVTHDQGKHWTVRSLGVAGLDVPTIATSDGVVADAFLRSHQGIQHFRSTDGGETWSETLPRITLPGVLASDDALAGRDFGALARADHSLLIWIADTTPVYLNSQDGRSFEAYRGPAGEVHAVESGFVALGDKAEVSLDCVNWAPATLPAPIVPTG